MTACDQCAAVCPRSDALHFCDCRDQMALCCACRPLCVGDEQCGEVWRALKPGAPIVLRLKTQGLRQAGLFT